MASTIIFVAAHVGISLLPIQRHFYRAHPGSEVALVIVRARCPQRDPAADATYICPMHPEVRQRGPGSCPKCGMALEPETPSAGVERIEYTCPMHPEIVRPEPGACPICGMALEPRTVVAEESNPELVDMTRRLWVSAVLTLPLFLLAMSRMIWADQFHAWLPSRVFSLIEFGLATPVVLWGGWPFFVRMWQSFVNRSPNMFTLIGIGTLTAYVHSTDCHIFSRRLSRVVSYSRRGWFVFRIGCGDHHARVAGPGAGTSRSQPDRRGHSCAARPGAQNGAATTGRWR